MADPFTAWLRLMRAGWDMTRTGQRASEAISASGKVMSRRTDIIAAAMRSPWTGDYVELSRMLPEKIEAFSDAGTAMAEQWWSIQAAFTTEAVFLSGIFLRGRPLTLAELGDASTRTISLAVQSVERAVALGGSGLAPVHAKVTANARRLRKGPSGA